MITELLSQNRSCHLLKTSLRSRRDRKREQSFGRGAATSLGGEWGRRFFTFQRAIN